MRTGILKCLYKIGSVTHTHTSDSNLWPSLKVITRTYKNRVSTLASFLSSEPPLQNVKNTMLLVPDVQILPEEEAFTWEYTAWICWRKMQSTKFGWNPLQKFHSWYVIRVPGFGVPVKFTQDWRFRKERIKFGWFYFFLFSFTELIGK